MSRADNIRQRLEWRPSIANPPGDKPKGMLWRTYCNQLSEYHNFAHRLWMGVAERLELVNRRLGSCGLDPLEDLGLDG